MKRNKEESAMKRSSFGISRRSRHSRLGEGANRKETARDQQAQLGYTVNRDDHESSRLPAEEDLKECITLSSDEEMDVKDDSLDKKVIPPDIEIRGVDVSKRKPETVRGLLDLKGSAPGTQRRNKLDGLREQRATIRKHPVSYQGRGPIIVNAFSLGNQGEASGEMITLKNRKREFNTERMQKCQQQTHKKCDKTQMLKNNDELLSEHSRRRYENNEGSLSPPPPVLTPQVSPEKVAQLRAESVAYPGNSASLLAETYNRKATIVKPGTASATLTAPHGVTNFSRMPPMAAPVLYYAPMFLCTRPYGASSGMPPNLMAGIFPEEISLQINQQGFLQLDHRQQSSWWSICTECGTPFSVEANLRSHMKEAHPNQCWKCPECFEVMLSPREFEHHFSQCKK